MRISWPPTKAQHTAIMERDRWTCYLCGADLRELPPADRHIDHIVPRAGGGDPCDAANMAACCRSCNCSKRHTPLRRWYQDQVRIAERPHLRSQKALRPVRPWGEIKKELKLRTARKVRVAA